jgi:hypothetical protein
MDECYDPNLNDKLNNTFYNIGLLNCFYLFKRCFEYVNGTFHKKTNGKFISSLKFTN